MVANCKPGPQQVRAGWNATARQRIGALRAAASAIVCLRLAQADLRSSKRLPGISHEGSNPASRACARFLTKAAGWVSFPGGSTCIHALLSAPTVREGWQDYLAAQPQLPPTLTSLLLSHPSLLLEPGYHTSLPARELRLRAFKVSFYSASQLCAVHLRTVECSCTSGRDPIPLRGSCAQDLLPCLSSCSSCWRWRLPRSSCGASTPLVGGGCATCLAQTQTGSSVRCQELSSSCVCLTARHPRPGGVCPAEHACRRQSSLPRALLPAPTRPFARQHAAAGQLWQEPREAAGVGGQVR